MTAPVGVILAGAVVFLAADSRCPPSLNYCFTSDHCQARPPDGSDNPLPAAALYFGLCGGWWW